MKKIKVNENMLLSGGLLLVTVAQFVLSSKKESGAYDKLKKEVTEEVMNNLSKNN